MESSTSSTYRQKRQWILFSGLAVLLSMAAFFAPSRLTEYSFPETYESLKYGDLFDYLNIYSLLLIPVIVAMIATNNLMPANILTSLYIVFQVDHSQSFSKLILFNLEGFIYIWFLVGALAYIMLYKDISRHFLSKWARAVLIIFTGLFTSANFFLALHPALEFGPFGIFTIFCLTLMLFSASDILTATLYWPLLMLLSGIAFYIITVELNCNVEYFGDMGIINNNPAHILKSCSTYYLWLLIGFVLPISIRIKIRNAE